MPNYTKGEWRVHKFYLNNTWRVVGEHNWQVCEYIKHEADAHLIAAAPQMYEAAKVALDLVKVVLYDHPDDDIAQTQKQVIEQALAKAEGREYASE